jgi:hypothetical protein
MDKTGVHLLTKMHSLTNHNFCDTCGNAVRPEITPLRCMGYVVLGDRMINSFTVCEIWK